MQTSFGGCVHVLSTADALSYQLLHITKHFMRTSALNDKPVALIWDVNIRAYIYAYLCESIYICTHQGLFYIEFKSRGSQQVTLSTCFILLSLEVNFSPQALTSCHIQDSFPSFVTFANVISGGFVSCTPS